jgi:penicillin-insensitive murein endopeptidase
MFGRIASLPKRSGAPRAARRLGVAAIALLLIGARPGTSPDTPAPDTPAPGPLRIIGSEGGGGGCIAGAVRLPAQGPGFQTIHLGRSSFWGAPQTIAGVEILGRQAEAAGLGTLYVEDIARPRGGPLPGGHAAHQLGLDADIGLDTSRKPTLTPATREAVELPSLVAPDQRGVDPALWSGQTITLLKLAAALPGVDRVLVNPAIKKQLCQDVQGDRVWLRLIRPWWGHAAHMHIHFRCPDGQPECVQQVPPPPGDGCDATLQWWFDQLNAPPAPPAAPKPRPSPPAACAAVMRMPAGS